MTFNTIFPFCIAFFLSISLAHEFQCHIDDFAPSKNQELKITITTNRLKISTLDTDNGPFFKTLMKNIDCFMPYSSGSLPSDPTVDKHLSGIYQKNKTGNPFSAYIIRLRTPKDPENDNPIGWIELCRHSTMVELAFMIHPLYWHCGYGTEAVGAICKGLIPWLQEHQEDKEFSHLKIDKISTLYAVVKLTNRPSQKILKRFGFVSESTESLHLSEEVIYKAPII